MCIGNRAQLQSTAPLREPRQALHQPNRPPVFIHPSILSAVSGQQWMQPGVPWASTSRICSGLAGGAAATGVPATPDMDPYGESTASGPPFHQPRGRIRSWPPARFERLTLLGGGERPLRPTEFAAQVGD